MRHATTVFLLAIVLTTSSALAQKTDYVYRSPQSDDLTQPYSDEMGGGQFSGPLSVTGPFDLDGDGKVEVLLTDYSGGQRVHVFEVQGADAWEMVYSTPYHEVTSVGTRGARYATAGDLDGDGMQEIIFISGQNWAETETHPLPDRGTGIFVFEYTGTDNDYGSEPAAVFGADAFGTPNPDYIKSDNFSVVDVDGDGTQELLYANDASSYNDWYVLSVNGDIGSGFATLVEELRLPSGADPDIGSINRGGGSTYAVNAADLDGDGTFELSLHSWNSFNFTNADVTGADSYAFPEDGDENIFLQATAPTNNDDLSWFNGVVVDINGDGDDEVFYPREYGYLDGLEVYEHVSVLNYEDGEDVLQITTDQLILDLVGPLTSYGIDAADINGDGIPELIGAGRGFDGRDLTAGENPKYLRIAEWIGGEGGDPEDAANYRITEVEFEVTSDDSLFNVVYRDSLGTESMYYENAGSSGAYPQGEPEELSPNRIAYLGDADGDGYPEVAASFYGINDTLNVYDEVWNADSSRFDRTVREQIVVENRPMMRIFELNDVLGVAIDDADRPLPANYVLEQNYPNPFNPSTQIEFAVPVASHVKISVFDVAGRRVDVLVDQTVSAGRHEVVFDGSNLSSGIYLIRMDTPEGFTTRRAVLIK